MSKRNENRPDYKKTKVGWIPKGWDFVYLKDVAKINPTRPKNIDREIFVSFISMSDVSEEGFIISHQKKRYKEVENGYTFFSNGDILIAKITPCFENGKGALAINLINGIGFGSTEFHVIRTKNSDTKLIYYLTLSSPFRKRGESNMTGSAGQKRVPTDFIKSFVFPLPPLPEQKKIAEILSAWDRAIEQNRRLIDAKQRLKKGLMQQLLTGRMRFPEFGKPVEKKGEVPEGWKECKLINCFKERKEHDPNLQLLSITSDRGVIHRDEVDRKDNSNADKSKYKRITTGDIGYNTMRMWQGVSSVSELEGIVSPAYTICEPKGGHSSIFFGYLFKYTPMVNLFRRFSQGLVDDTLNLKFPLFSQIKVAIPKEKEQNRIASMLRACDKEIEKLQNLIDTLVVQKKGLMQKLLTGEVRVKVKREQ